MITDLQLQLQRLKTKVIPLYNRVENILGTCEIVK